MRIKDKKGKSEKIMGTGLGASAHSKVWPVVLVFPFFPLGSPILLLFLSRERDGGQTVGKRWQIGAMMGSQRKAHKNTWVYFHFAFYLPTPQCHPLPLNRGGPTKVGGAERRWAAGGRRGRGKNLASARQLCR